MPSDKLPPLAASRHAQLRVYAIHITKKEAQNIPEYKSERLRRPLRLGSEEFVEEPLPTLMIVHFLAEETRSVWRKARRGMVTLKGHGDSRTTGCAVVLADNSSLEARETPTPEQLEEIQKVLGTVRKPRWYWLE
ncbi:hypothetical protein VKT23_017846 [Stygiomarasmius scandens]